MNSRSIFRYSYGLIVSQRVVQLLFVVFILITLLFIFGLHIQAVNGDVQSVSIYNGKPIMSHNDSGTVGVLADIFVQFMFFTTVFICLVATAHMIPDLFIRRTMLFILVKPVSRRAVLAGLYGGTIAAVLTLQGIFVFSIWAVLCLKIQAISWSLLATIPPLAIAFSSMYSFGALLALRLKSTGGVISGMLIYMLFISTILANRDTGLLSNINHGPVKFGITALYYALPQIHDLQIAASHSLSTGSTNLVPLFCSISSGAAAFLIGMRYFEKIDF